MSDEAERMQILEMIESGKISAEDGLSLLQSLNGQLEIDEEAAELEQDHIPEEEISLAEEIEPPVEEVQTPETAPHVQPPPPETHAETIKPEHTFPADTQKWRQWWMIPLWIGVAVTISGGFLMYWAQDSSGIGLWFICASVPFLIGIAVMALAWHSRSAPWLHLRIQQKPGERPQRIAFSFPLPIRPTAWFLRTFGNKIPQLKETSLDEVIMAVGETTSPDNPIYIQADEGDDGEKVEIFIG